MIPIASIGYNRPEMQHLSLEYLARCPEAKATHLYIYIDGGNGMPKARAEEIAEYFEPDFHTITLKYHENHVGLSRNILGAMGDALEGRLIDEYGAVCIMEDDVLVSRDFLKYQNYMQEHVILDFEDTFTVTGFVKFRQKPGGRNLTDEEAVKSVVSYRWYTPDGVVINTRDWKKISPHVTEEYYTTPHKYLDRFAERLCPNKDEGFWKEGKHRFPQQAGLINTIRDYHDYRQVVPCVSRCQDIGVYGHNQKQKTHKGEDITSEEFQKQAGWNSGCFQENYEWDKLEHIGNAGPKGPSRNGSTLEEK